MADVTCTVAQNTVICTITASEAICTVQAIINNGIAVDFSANDVSAEKDVAITFTSVITGGTATQWHWDFGDGTTSHLENPSKTYTAVGTYTVVLVASTEDRAGVETKANYITVTDTIAPTGYTIAFGIDPYDGLTIQTVSIIAAGCEVGATYNYSISSSGGGTPVIGNGTVAAAGFTISNINCNGLSEGTLTVIFYLTDTSGNVGANVTDTATYVAYDADAVIYFNTLSITDNTEKNALNRLVLNWKGIGNLNVTKNYWTDTVRIHPYVGAAADKIKYNLRDVSTCIFTFFGGWTHDSNGSTPNGTNGYLRTGMDILEYKSTGFVKISGFNSNTIGGVDGFLWSTNRFVYDAASASVVSGHFIHRGFGNEIDSATGGYDIRSVYFNLVRSGVNYYRRKKTQLSSTPSNLTPSSSPTAYDPLAAISIVGSLSNYDNKTRNFDAMLNVSLSDAEMNILYDIIDQFQSDLSRNNYGA